jgi:hypothetical protein
LQSFIWNVRNFGYLGNQPNMSNRTVNEAAVSALYINSLFFGRRNPGLDCGAGAKAASSCILRRGFDCLAACRMADDAPRPPPSVDPLENTPPLASIAECKRAPGHPAQPAALRQSESEISLAFGAEDSACFRRIFKGRFKGSNFDLACEEGKPCTLSLVLAASPLQDVAQLNPALSNELISHLDFISDHQGNQVFETQRKLTSLDQGSLALSCAQGRCSLSLVKLDASAQPGFDGFRPTVSVPLPAFVP